jgi:FkbM family methyltransferase
MKNEEYLHRMNNGLVSQRLSHIVNFVDFSKVKTILDIGSWHLDQSIEFMNIFPNANVYAFEPNPDSANLCRRRVEGMGHENSSRIFVNELALTNKKGTIKFYPLDASKTNSTNHGMSSTLRLKDGMDGSWHNDKWVQKEIEVEATTLDSWCSENNIVPDLLWVDVQGAEYNLYEGGKNTIKNHVMIILTEVGIVPYYEGHTVKPDIDKLLKNELGMEEVEDSFEMADSYEANTIYIKREKIS